MNYQTLKYIYQPSGEANAYTLLLLHGTGGNETDLLPLATHFQSPVNILSVRGNVLEHGMPRFFKRLGMGIFDEKDLKFRTEELVHFLADTAKKEHFNPDKVIALGYSNGANIAGAVLVNYPSLLAGAILFRPMQPYQEMPDFLSNGKPLLLTSGKFDPTINNSATQNYVSALQKGGYLVEHVELATGHQLTQEDLSLAVNWYNQHFNDGKL